VKKWKPPDMGSLKLNWDVAICSLTKKMGVGAVLRDEHGAVVAATISVIPYIRDPSVVEAIALWKAVSFCWELGCPRVVFEGDSMQVVQALNNGQAWNRYAQLLVDVRTLSHGFTFHKIQLVSRDANKVAHDLAKLVVTQPCDSMWIGECPSPIQHLVSVEFDLFD